MNPDTLAALRGSIAKWESIVAGTGADQRADNCALCHRFPGIDDDDEEKYAECAREGEGGAVEHCPVSLDRGLIDCRGTPYQEWLYHQHHVHFIKDELRIHDACCVPFAQAELDFLRGLLP